MREVANAVLYSGLRFLRVPTLSLSVFWPKQCYHFLQPCPAVRRPLGCESLSLRLLPIGYSGMIMACRSSCSVESRCCVPLRSFSLARVLSSPKVSATFKAEAVSSVCVRRMDEQVRMIEGCFSLVPKRLTAFQSLNECAQPKEVFCLLQSDQVVSVRRFVVPYVLQRR